VLVSLHVWQRPCSPPFPARLLSQSVCRQGTREVAGWPACVSCCPLPGGTLLHPTETQLHPSKPLPAIACQDAKQGTMQAFP
jgi:hypothetical protein